MDIGGAVSRCAGPGDADRSAVDPDQTAAAAGGGPRPLASAGVIRLRLRGAAVVLRLRPRRPRPCWIGCWRRRRCCGRLLPVLPAWLRSLLGDFWGRRVGWRERPGARRSRKRERRTSTVAHASGSDSRGSGGAARSACPDRADPAALVGLLGVFLPRWDDRRKRPQRKDQQPRRNDHAR